MNRRDAVVTIPAAIAAVALTLLRRLKANAIPAGRRIVSQAELKRVGSLWDEAELLAADIRRRLEAGAEFERGELGASAWGRGPLGEIGIGDADHCDGFGILEIGPANDHTQFRDEVLQDHPELADEVAAKVWV